MKPLLESSVLTKLIYTVAASTVIGGGTIVINSQARVAVLENRAVLQEARLERIEAKIDALLLRGS